MPPLAARHSESCISTHLYSSIGRLCLFDNIAMSRSYVTTGVLNELFRRTNAIGVDINTYKEQNNSVLKTPTAPGP